MGLISKSSLEDLVAIQNNISEQAKKSPSLENAAQEYMSILYDQFAESIVLARFFATISFKGLPKTNREFVYNLIKS